MVINHKQQYDELVERMNREMHLCTPIFRDIHKHPASNPTLCIGYTFFNGDFYTLSITHQDAPIFDIPKNTFLTLHTDRINTLGYVANMSFPEIEDVFSWYVKETHMMFQNTKDVNKIVPITVWSSVIRKYHNTILHKLNGADDIAGMENTFIKIAVSVLRKIESAGLAVDEKLLISHFGDKVSRLITDGLVYSQYHPYTMTGRPSNRFGKINFAALNKTDGSRAAFISRFAGGNLVQMDFEAYHLRLIGHYMNIDMPIEPIHTYLAKQYYQKDFLTKEEYEEGKQITFSILYGADVETDIPLLKSIKELSRRIYSDYQERGFVAPISKRRIHVQDQDVSEHKLFNYFVQCYEFEKTIPKLKSVLEYLEDKKSKLILYTYDAILLDCHPDEISTIKHDIREILQQENFPVRLYSGINYDVLKEEL